MTNPFRNWTEADIRSHNERIERKALDKWTPAAKKESRAVERERDLHEQIIQHCQNSRWLYFHSRMDQKSTATVGQPDFTILLPAGRVLFIECKAKGGKLRPEQQRVKMVAECLGHTVHVIYSFDEFLNIL